MYLRLKLAERHPVIHNLVISNVPGPPFPLYFAGAKLTGLYPLGPIFDGAGLNITVLSYTDSMGFGFIACRELMPRLWDLATAVGAATAELCHEQPRQPDRARARSTSPPARHHLVHDPVPTSSRGSHGHKRWSSGGCGGCATPG